MTTSLTFHVEHRDGYSPPLDQVVPVLGGTPLTDLIHEFERHRGWQIGSADYGALIPAFFRFGTAETHFMALPGAHLDDAGRVPLLGCQCGEWGCWPLLARIDVTDRLVTWSDFTQPHRPDRDYSAFGPFAFERATYEHELGVLATVWDRTQTEGDSHE